MFDEHRCIADADPLTNDIACRARLIMCGDDRAQVAALRPAIDQIGEMGTARKAGQCHAKADLHLAFVIGDDEREIGFQRPHDPAAPGA